jgi:predicted DNA-binding protein
LGQRVPPKYRRRIDKFLAEEQARSEAQKIRTELTYVDIHEKIEGMKKKRTTVWLPETTVAKLKKLSVATGAPMAELFRRAVEAYLKRS